MTDTTIIIPNWNGAKWLPGCLDALSNQSTLQFETLVVDNGSTDNSIQICEEHLLQPKILRLERNFGFAYAVNRGIGKSKTTYVALLNNDTRTDQNWLQELVSALDVAADNIYGIGSLMLSMQTKHLIDDAGNSLSWYGAASKLYHRLPVAEVSPSKDVFSVSGGASIYRRSFFDQVGLFDEHFESYLEDVDLGLRARMHGLSCKLNPKAITLHQSHGSALEHKQYIKLITCNRLLLFWKNIPISLLIRKLPSLIYGQIYFFIAYGKPIFSLVGYMRFFRLMFKVERVKHPTISNSSILQLLTTEPPQPPLLHFLGGYWSALRNKLSRI